MTPNKTLIEKADLEIANLQTDGGYLSDQQADKFIRLAIKESVLLPMISVTSMNGPREERDKIRFSGRVLRPGSPGVALTTSQRVKPDLSKFTLDAKEFKADVRLNDSTMEDSIERGTFKDTVMSSLAGAVSRDVEFVAVQGDTASADTLLAVLDGFLKQATSNIVNAASSHLDKAVLRDMLKTLPDEFAKTEKLKYFTNRQARLDYRDSLADRATALGDANLTQSDRTVFQDMQVVAVPEFPNPASVTNVLLTDPGNLTVGFWRKIRIETDRDVAAGVTLLVATVRFDVKIQEVAAVSKATNVSTT
jgi:HK97 family phage major capsid protein